MGMFDVFVVEDEQFGEIKVQTKEFDCVLDEYRVGDLVTMNSYGVEVQTFKEDTFTVFGSLISNTRDPAVQTRTVFIVLYNGICVEAYSKIGDLDESEVENEVFSLQHKWLNNPHAAVTVAKHSLFEYSKKNNSLNATLINIQKLIDAYNKQEQLMNDPKWFDKITYASAIKYLEKGYTLGEAVEDEISKCELENTGVV